MKKKLLFSLLILLIIPCAFIFAACNNGNNSNSNDVVAVQSISLNQQSITLTTGDTYTLTATINPSNATNKTITWSSSNSNVVSVNNGHISAIGVGNANISAQSSNGKSAICSVIVKEQSPVSDLQFEIYGNGYAVTGYTGTDTTIEVPSTYNGKNVIAIGTGKTDEPNGFYKNYDLVSITLPSTLKEINAYSFAYCLSLTNISIPNCKLIGKYAFQDCANLTKIELPNDCITISSSIFYNCNKLKDVTINSGSINSSIFNGCTSIQNLTIGEDVSEISNGSFINCTSLVNLHIPFLPSTIGELFGSVDVYVNIYNNCFPDDTVGKSYTYQGTQYIYQIPASNCSWYSYIQWYTYNDNKVLYMGEALDVVSYAYDKYYIQITPTISIEADNYKVPKYANLKCYYFPETLKNLHITNQDIEFDNSLLLKLPFDVVVGSKIIYELNGGENSPSNPCTYSKFKEITLEEPTKRGFTFIGWTGSNGTTPQKDITIPVGTIGEKTFAANWEINNYSIEYDLNGGSVDGNNPDNFNILSKDITLINPIRKGYEFLGWTNSEITTPQKDITIKSGSIGSRSYTAQWEIITYNITYDLGGWVGTLDNPANYTIEDEIIFNNPYSDVVSFIGWKSNNLPITHIPKGSTGDISLVSDWGLDNNFKYRITTSELSVIGVKDKSIEAIIVPDYVMSISEGAFSYCRNLKEITLPFVGSSKNTTVADGSTLFGYIFGTKSYTGGVATEQYYNNNYSTYYIPSTLQRVTITNGEILYGTFSNCSNLISVKISDSIENIGERAFYNCSNLTSITIPDNVESIGAYALYNCKGITNIDLSGCTNLTTIREYAFENCSSLTKINISNIEQWLNINFANYLSNPLYYANNLYINDKLVTELVIPNTITEIKSFSFTNCDSLTKVDLLNCTNLIKIGESTFSNCSSLTKVNIASLEQWLNISFVDSGSNPLCYAKTLYINNELVTDLILPDVEEIKAYTFYACNNITSINLSNCTNLIKIGNYAFYNCINLTSVTIPNTVKSIGDYTFSNCRNLTGLTIPNGVGSIGSHALENCSSITSVLVPNSVQSIGFGTFSGCNNLINIILPFVGGTTNASSYIYYCPFGYIFGTTSYTESTRTEQYRYDPYEHSIINEHYYIPNSLKSVTITSGNVLYGAFSNCSNLTSIILSDGVISISERAFYNCSNLTSITIPDNVESIGAYAFSSCRNLTGLTIPDSIESIGHHAFSGCGSITSITIPNKVQRIDDYAFSSCRNLTSIILSDGVRIIGVGAFSDCTNLTTITIPNKVRNFGDYAFSDCSNLTAITIPDSLEVIGNHTFENCSSLTSITIPDKVQRIGDYAFYNCSNLISLTIPIGIHSIGAYAFYNCKRITSIDLSNCTNLTVIETYTFYGCSNLISIILPNNVESISSHAFENCSSATSLILPNTVKNIGDDAFYGWSNLTSVIIPNSVKNMGFGAFSGCFNLTIYSESNTEPSGWSSYWNYNYSPVYWYCGTRPSTSGNYWHYVDGVVTIWE